MSTDLLERVDVGYTPTWQAIKAHVEDPKLDDPTPPPPTFRDGALQGEPDNALTYLGGPRCGGVTIASTEVTSVEVVNEDGEDIYYYRRGISPSGRDQYLYDGYRWEAL